MKTFLLCVAGAFVCTACHPQSRGMANAFAADAVDQSQPVKGGANIEPGDYEYQSHTTDMKVPGAGPDYAAKQIEDEGRGQTITKVRHCVSRQEALDPVLIFSLEDKACRAQHVVMSGGTIDLQLFCRHGDVTENTTVVGNYTPTSFSVDVSNSVSGGPQSGAEMKNHLDAQRIGACPDGPSG